MSQINLRLPDELKKMAERYARRYGYRSIQELAKESIRMRIGSNVVKGLSPKIKGEVSGKELIRKLSPEARKGLEEISKLPKYEWKKWYRKMKEKEKARAKYLMQAY